MMREPGAGELDRRILLRLQTDVPNAGFGLDQTFSAGTALWAKHEPVHSLAIRSGMQTGEAPTDFFWVRRAAGLTQPENITAAHVIEWDGQRYRVLEAIDVNGTRRFTRVTAKLLGAI